LGLKFYRKFSFPNWTTPVFLGLIAVLTFGLLIPWLGYYWDDWAKMLVYRLYGLAGYWPYYAYDRPLSAWTHVVFTPLLGDAPLAWHLFSLVLRWLTAWAMYWAFSILWPQAKRQVFYAALLFLVYPVFSQQSIALTFHQMWVQYLLFFISLGATFQSIRQPQRGVPWTILAVACMALQLSVSEYFVGIEFLRPILILILVSQNESVWRRRLLNTLRYCIPYLAIMMVYLVWRFYFMKLTEPDPYTLDILSGLFTATEHTLMTLEAMLFADLRYIFVTTWTQLFDMPFEELKQPAILISVGVAILGGILCLVYLLKRGEEGNGAKENSSWWWQAILVGIYGLLLGGAPAWITRRLITLDFHSNRHAMATMLGLSLLFIGLLEWFVQRRTQRAIILALLVSMAMVLNLRAANGFRHDWQEQLEFFWQLYWRAPFIQPDTAIIMEEDPFPNNALFSISSAINTMYPQEKNPPRLGYYLYSLRAHWSGFTHAPDEINFSTKFRSFSFKTSTPNSLLFVYDSTHKHCLWLVYPDERANPYLPDLVAVFSHVSNPDRIQVVPPQVNFPPKDIFRKEPGPNWCYYFEKADLARQTGDWQTVISLVEQAKLAGFEPGVHPAIPAYEWTPFVEAYAMAGQWQAASDLTMAAYQYDSEANEMFCSLWGKIAASVPSAKENETVQTVFSELSCQP
jgi:hypothetical protein